MPSILVRIPESTWIPFGDIPIREGDRVTTQTVITTIDQNEALEAYIEVPLDRAPELRVGLPADTAAGRSTRRFTLVVDRP